MSILSICEKEKHRGCGWFLDLCSNGEENSRSSLLIWTLRKLMDLELYLGSKEGADGKLVTQLRGDIEIMGRLVCFFCKITWKKIRFGVHKTLFRGGNVSSNFPWSIIFLISQLTNFATSRSHFRHQAQVIINNNNNNNNLRGPMPPWSLRPYFLGRCPLHSHDIRYIRQVGR